MIILRMELQRRLRSFRMNFREGSIWKKELGKWGWVQLIYTDLNGPYRRGMISFLKWTVISHMTLTI
jgi:hypothetical protein